MMIDSYAYWLHMNAVKTCLYINKGCMIHSGWVISLYHCIIAWLCLVLITEDSGGILKTLQNKLGVQLVMVLSVTHGMFIVEVDYCFHPFIRANFSQVLWYWLPSGSVEGCWIWYLLQSKQKGFEGADFIIIEKSLEPMVDRKREGDGWEVALMMFVCRLYTPVPPSPLAVAQAGMASRP